MSEPCLSLGNVWYCRYCNGLKLTASLVGSHRQTVDDCRGYVKYPTIRRRDRRQWVSSRIKIQISMVGQIGLGTKSGNKLKTSIILDLSLQYAQCLSSQIITSVD